ncbi:MAG: hypothetical protein HeimC2_12860 [Candidatus Heimdallarchaeota archaeon LC_2]|nr:MAG: hypothetical protein HeimC2_12860 [Candidatus Heimdallarchaeota archaeon LC_2]
MIGSSKSVKKEADNVLETNIPLEMFKYKFLMNPIRLAMVKMLSVHDNLTSIQIKNSLEISWDEYYTNIKALESKSYITVDDNFDKEMRRQFVYLQKEGRQDYINLMTLLQDFADDPLSLDVNQIHENTDEEDLYPKHN